MKAHEWLKDSAVPRDRIHAAKIAAERAQVVMDSVTAILSRLEAELEKINE